MFLLRQPTAPVINRFLQSQARLDFTYLEVGATATNSPEKFVVDHTRIRLGSGEELFRSAKRAVEGWRQFDLGWLHAYPADTPIRAGEVVAVVARTGGVWSVNAARIVYVLDEPRRFGFAYGTLPGHVERGEERFLVERLEDDSVWYDIKAFSQPMHILTKLGYPLVRRLQKRFGRESAAAMQRAANELRENR
ncbi:MAG: DUF1990 domain-containing protein [Pirellula sp.]|nr:DUF1990 domain-containing protein [Pirellula sp.]